MDLDYPLPSLSLNMKCCTKHLTSTKYKNKHIKLEMKSIEIDTL